MQLHRAIPCYGCLTAGMARTHASSRRSDSVPVTNHGLQDLAQFKRMVDCEGYGAVHGFVLERDGDQNIRYWVSSSAFVATAVPWSPPVVLRCRMRAKLQQQR